MKNKKVIYIGSALVLVGLFFIISMNYKKSQRQALGFIAEKNAEVFVRDYSPRYGSEDAKIYLTEFLDPECESCRSFYPQVKKLLKDYEGKVQLVIRYAPFHRNAKLAIKALEAARIQGKYWEALETLFQYQPYWGDHHNPKPELIFEYLAKLDLDMTKLKTDMNDPAIEKNIDQDMEDLKTLKVRATPTFFVNGKPLVRFGIEYLNELLQQEVKEKY